MNRTRGFAITELLTVIVIIGLLGSILIPNRLGAHRRAYDTGALSCGMKIQSAMEAMQIDRKNYARVATARALLALGSDNTDCARPTMLIENPFINQSTYRFTIRDTRGGTTYTVTPTHVFSH